MSEEQPRRAAKRAEVHRNVADTATAEQIVARLARLGHPSRAVDIVVTKIVDDPATAEVESGLSVVADVPADCLEAARNALRIGGEENGEGGI